MPADVSTDLTIDYSDSDGSYITFNSGTDDWEITGAAFVWADAEEGIILTLPAKAAPGPGYYLTTTDDQGTLKWTEGTSVIKEKLPCDPGWYGIFSEDGIGCYNPKHYSLIKTENLTIKGEQMQYFTASNIIFTTIIVILVSKFILPKLNLRTGVRAFFRLIYKPFKKAEAEVEREWTEVKSGDSADWLPFDENQH
jgi:hypothetical protein